MYATAAMLRPMRNLVGLLTPNDRAFLKFSPSTKVPELTEQIAHAADQDVFPIVDAGGVLRGIIAAEALRVIASNPELHQLAVAAGRRSRSRSIRTCAAPLMVLKDLRSVPVTDAGGAIVGLIDEHDITTAATQ